MNQMPVPAELISRLLRECPEAVAAHHKAFLSLREINPSLFLYAKPKTEKPVMNPTAAPASRTAKETRCMSGKVRKAIRAYFRENSVADKVKRAIREYRQQSL